MPDAFADFQFGIYGAGLAGRRPQLPISAAGLQARAKETLSPEVYGYVAGGAGAERTMAANLAAFERWRIVPRMLRDVSVRDLSTTVLGTAMPAPVMLAPIGGQSIVHPDAELATGRAAAAVGVPFVLSTASSRSLEDVAAAVGEARRWFQLYWPPERELAASIVARAEAAGFGAIVVTLDTWLLGWRPRDLEHAFLPILPGALDTPAEEDPEAAIAYWKRQFANPRVTWADLAWLREQTTLPIVLKGILHADDARLALDAGVDALIVSNHGGRQVDGALGALDALPVIRDAVGEELPILFDSGIRTGADIFKALALGANAVCIGRPFVWGLALGGRDGVEHVLRCLLAEFDLTLALSGYTEVAQLGREALAQTS